MSEGVIPSEEFNEQLKKYVRENMRRERGNMQSKGRWHKKGSSGGGGSSSTGCCNLHTVPDVTHPSFTTTKNETKRRWKIVDQCTKGDLASITKTVGTDYIVWPGGSPIVVLNESTGEWVLDVSDELVVYNSDDEDITGTVTPVGTFKRVVDLSGKDQVTLDMSFS